MLNKAVFIDRDGTINSDSSYINKVKDFEFYPFVYKALQIIRDKNYKLIIISNQSGVGRGYIKEETLELINEKIHNILKKYNVYFDDIFYAYYYDNAVHPKYKKFPHWRKPEPGMILEAAEKYNIDLNKSYMIGDRISDIKCGKRAGCKTILVKTGDGEKTLKTIKNDKPKNIKPDFVSDDLLDAAKNYIV